MTFEAKGFWRDRIAEVIKAENENEAMKLLAEKHYIELTNKGKPQTNIYIDGKDGEAIKSGYIYRVRDNIDGKRVFFDAWTSIYELNEIDYKELN